MPGEIEIADKLIFLITSGRFKAHDKLPSENEIADKFKVPRIVARKAYERLEDLGYVYKKQGKGSYVRERSRQIELVLSGDVSFTQKMRDKGYNFYSRNVCCKPIKFNPKIYDYLAADPGARIFKIGRLRFIDDRPIALHFSYVSQTVFPEIEAEGKDITSMFAYYHSKGYREFSAKSSIISVVFPTKSQRKLLECANLVPLLTLESGCVDKMSGKVLEYQRIFYRSDSFSYVLS